MPRPVLYVSWPAVLYVASFVYRPAAQTGSLQHAADHWLLPVFTGMTASFLSSHQRFWQGTGCWATMRWVRLELHLGNGVQCKAMGCCAASAFL